ncbi:MAG: NAD-dependent epimerase/dehydratase family protein [Actinomycetia bacterium]|nr:NAD-dependent epimerase/dehydratase family protein [Actinomycetes bacterium]
MRAYVTGATGFVGGHVAKALAAAGADVRTDRVDLRDAAAVLRAVEGCDAVFHVAALYSYDADREAIEAVNVGGTRHVVEACVRHGVSRLVHTSTAGTCGPVEGRVATEEDEPPAWELKVPYKATKLSAERLVLAAAAEGLDTVVVNPTTPVGEGDRKPTPTGRMVASVARGRIKGYVATTGLNVVNVHDVAQGHLLAYERGEAGQRYLLGGTNLALRELFAVVADLAGRPRPRVRVPYAVAAAAAAVRLANPNEVRLARLPMYFSSEKAQNRLGYQAGPIEPALKRAVADALGEEKEGV